MQKFNLAYQHTLGHEGGYVNDPDDKGGETYKGIARVHWPLWTGWMHIDRIKAQYDYNQVEMLRALSDHSVLQNLVKEFYKDAFWNPANLDHLPIEISMEIFDTGVNQGLGTAVKYFQEALNYLNNNQRDFKDLKVDGGLGNKSLEAFKAYMATADKSYYRSEARNLKTLLKVMNGLQFSNYVLIVEKNPGQEKFFYGWINRV